jgi:Haem-NO-binding
MHGLIFVTWEKYLTERFGGSLLSAYRDAIGETPSDSPLASRLYDDATLLAGVGAANRLTGIAADMLLREYGRYFIINGLTSHLCSYVLSQIHSGQALLLAMRDVHARLRQTREGLTPPLFNYETSSYANEKGGSSLSPPSSVFCSSGRSTEVCENTGAVSPPGAAKGAGRSGAGFSPRSRNHTRDELTRPPADPPAPSIYHSASTTLCGSSGGSSASPIRRIGRQQC